MNLSPLTDALIEQATDVWALGWTDGHLGLVPDALVALRTREDFRARLEKHCAETTLAVEDGRVLGFFILQADELYQFYVAAAARGTGVASDLIAAAEQALRERGVQKAWLACAVGNDRAARFYEKAGWTRTRREGFDVYTSQGPMRLDVWRYEKHLSP